MATKTLKKLKTMSTSKPAAVAARMRKNAFYVLIAFLVPATIVAVMIPLKIWVPGLAWLQ
jgi:hypothetical protein